MSASSVSLHASLVYYKPALSGVPTRDQSREGRCVCVAVNPGQIGDWEVRISAAATSRPQASSLLYECLLCEPAREPRLPQAGLKLAIRDKHDPSRASLSGAGAWKRAHCPLGSKTSGFTRVRGDREKWLSVSQCPMNRSSPAQYRPLG
jgi:hypothetical protein